MFLGSLIFVGLGLYNEYGISLRGLEKAKKAQKVYVELYTNPMPALSLENLEKLIGKPVVELKREDVEEKPEKSILEDAKKMDVVFLVPGDPMIATTHISLRLEAQKAGIETEVLNGVSIYSAAPSTIGLQIYKFGKTVTIPFPTSTYKPQTPYDVIKENMERGLHTLVLLDVDVEKKRWMTIREGLEYLLKIEAERREEVVTSKKLVIGLGGIGSPNPMVKGDSVERLVKYEFNVFPQTLIFPGKLHFMEVETLKVFAGVPEEVLQSHEHG